MYGIYYPSLLQRCRQKIKRSLNNLLVFWVHQTSKDQNYDANGGSDCEDGTAWFWIEAPDNDKYWAPNNGKGESQITTAFRSVGSLSDKTKAGANPHQRRKD